MSPFSANISWYERHETRTVIEWGIKLSHKRWACRQKYHQFSDMQVKYSLISLVSRGWMPPLRQGQRILPALQIRPVETCGERTDKPRNSSASLRHTEWCLARFQAPNELYFWFYCLTFTGGKKKYISNEAKGQDELGMYFPIMLRNEPSQNCT